MDERELAPSPPAQQWTSIDTYLDGLLRRRIAARRLPKLRPRTQPETPDPLLSTLPFVALLGMLGMLFFAIASLALPQSHQPPKRAAPAEQELGTAPKGWYQAAEKEFAAQQPSAKK